MECAGGIRRRYSGAWRAGFGGGEGFVWEASPLSCDADWEGAMEDRSDPAWPESELEEGRE